MRNTNQYKRTLQNNRGSDYYNNSHEPNPSSSSLNVKSKPKKKDDNTDSYCTAMAVVASIALLGAIALYVRYSIKKFTELGSERTYIGYIKER